MSLAQWLFLVLLSVLWGGSFFFVGVAVHELPTLTIVLARVTLAALVLLPLVFYLRLALPSTVTGWWPFVVMAILNNIIPFSMITLGQSQIASGLASVLNATTPLWTVLIVHVFTRDEKLTTNRLAGVVCGIAGVAILMGPEALFGEVASMLGMSAVLVGTVSYGFAGLWGRRLREAPPLVSAACQLAASAMLLAPVAIIVDRSWALPMPSPHVAAAVVGLAVLSTALAYIVFFHILRVSGATNVMLVTLLIPFSAVLLGVVVLSETLVLRHYLGGLTILSALTVFDGRLTAWLRERKAA
jgi:drug/metabolite transporter (DMT)-like permease